MISYSEKCCYVGIIAIVVRNLLLNCPIYILIVVVYIEFRHSLVDIIYFNFEAKFTII